MTGLDNDLGIEFTLCVMLTAISKRIHKDSARVTALINLIGIPSEAVKAEVSRILDAQKKSTRDRALEQAKGQQAAAQKRMEDHAWEAEERRFDFESPEHSGGGTAPAIWNLAPHAEAAQKGDTGPAPEHEWKDAELRFRNPDGTWGEFVELKGSTGPAPAHEVSGNKIRFMNPDGTWGTWVKAPKGEKGSDGKNGGTVIVRGGGGGGSGVDLASLLPGNDTAEPSGIVVFQGGKAVNLPWSAFLALAGTNSADHTARVDFVGETIIYRGEAAPGSDEAAPVWRIRKITFGDGGDVSTVYANGNAEFAHVWADRGTLTYL